MFTVKSKISGIGAYLPETVVTTNELMHEVNSRKFGVPESFLERASGIVQRRFSDDRESISYQAVQASVAAIQDAGIDPKDLDWVLFCGIHRDLYEPSQAHDIQAKLGAINASALDISNACIGLLNGLQIASAFIKAGSAENVLVCTGERPSALTKEIMRQLRISSDKQIFKKLLGAFTVGDSGGAFVVSKSHNQEGCIYDKFLTASEYKDLCYIKSSDKGVEFEMRMAELSSVMIDLHKRLINQTYESTGWTPSTVDRIYCHQIGAKPHIKLSKVSKQPVEKLPKTYDMFGNLTSATFAVNMYLNPPKKGEKVLLLGAGSGATVSQSAFQF